MNSSSIRHIIRQCSTNVSRKGHIVGCFKSGKEKASAVCEEDLTTAALQLNQKSGGELLRQLNRSKPVSVGECRVLYGLEDEAVAVVGLDERGVGVKEEEGWHQGRENVRSAVAAGVQALRSVGMTDVCIDSCGHSDAAAEGGTLSLFSYDELKSEEKARKKPVNLSLFQYEESSADVADQFDLGRKLGDGQNFARQLMEMPGNLLNPTTFTQIASQRFTGLNNVELKIRNREWIEKEQGMRALMAVAKGSVEEPKFLEIHINRTESNEDCTVMVGKGVTFDSGGISLKPGAGMDDMRGDMGGAASVIAAAHTFASLSSSSSKLQNVIGIIPLVENMPGGNATRPGDIVKARNGKSIKIDNTDAEGRLILADALSYASDTFKPTRIIDLATLTGACHVALGAATSGVFASHNQLWDQLYQASLHTGDRLWRMPLFAHYQNRIKCNYSDVNNIGKPNSGGGSCTAAAFLKNFVTCDQWAHLDIAGVMKADGELAYIKSGMTGRPTRTVVEWLRRL